MHAFTNDQLFYTLVSCFFSHLSLTRGLRLAAQHCSVGIILLPFNSNPLIMLAQRNGAEFLRGLRGQHVFDSIVLANTCQLGGIESTFLVPLA